MDVLGRPDGPDSPFCEPDWRWRRARYLANCGRRALRRRDDPWVRQAVWYLRALRRCEGDRAHRRLAGRYPVLCQAHALYAGGPSFQKWELEARLLASESWDAIARKCGLSADVVHVSHAVFFDVADKLRSRDWVTTRVLGCKAHVGLGERDTDILLKIYAFTGGPLAVDALIEYYRNPPVVPERPELLAPRELEALRTKLLIRASILARTLSADEKGLKKLRVLGEVMKMLCADEGRHCEPLATLQPATPGLPETGVAGGRLEDGLCPTASVGVA